MYHASPVCPYGKSGVNVKISTKHTGITPTGETEVLGGKTCPSANLSRKAWPGIELGTRSQKPVCCHTATARPSNKVRLDTRQKFGKEKRQSEGKWRAAVCRMGRNGCEVCQVSGQPILGQHFHPNTAVPKNRKIKNNSVHSFLNENLRSITPLIRTLVIRIDLTLTVNL